MDTENALDDLPQELVDQFVNHLQLVPRLGQMDDIVRALLFLCSEDSSFVTGETLKVTRRLPALPLTPVVSGPALCVASGARSVGRSAMADSEYRYVTYETLDDGTIARIMLEPARDPQRAAPRRCWSSSNEAFLRAEADDTVRVVILGGERADVLVGPRHRQQGDVGGAARRRTRTRPRTINGGTPRGRREPDAAGVALLLPEHAALAEPAQDHHRPGARRRCTPPA